MKTTSLQNMVIISIIFALVMIWAVLMAVLSWKAWEIMPVFRQGDVEALVAGASDRELKAYEEKIRLKMNRDLLTLRNKVPGGNYMVINVSENRYVLYNSKGIVREGICSTGNQVTLVGEDERSWTFRTPRGAFYVKDKIKNPVWKKPDWAFVEEGLPVPPADDPSRIEYGVLGDYALNLGNGYLIHGTLYQRQLGMPVTHGCIRLADEDLETVYNHLSVGSKILIF